MVESIAAQYYARVKSTAGVYQAWFDDFRYIKLNSKINDVGSFAIAFDTDNDDRFAYFTTDAIVEIYRTVPGLNLDWYLEFEGFHRKPSKGITEDGHRYFISEGVGFNHLLARTRIAYKAGTIRAEKYDAAETVMKEYVLENCGSEASISSVVGRMRNGVLPNFSVQADGGRGINWQGSRAFENLLDVLQDIAVYSSIDFDVIGYAPANFVFITYTSMKGADRTNIGLGAEPGKNAAGNPPVIFNINLGNAQNVGYEFDRSGEVTVVFVLGEGDGSTRDVLYRANDAAILASPWNRIETAVPTQVAQIPGLSEEAAAELKTYSMEQTGDEVLKERMARETFSFVPMQQPSTLYGLHYFLGDRVTVQYGDAFAHKRIVSIDRTFQDRKETISLEVTDWN